MPKLFLPLLTFFFVHNSASDTNTLDILKNDTGEHILKVHVYKADIPQIASSTILSTLVPTPVSTIAPTHILLKGTPSIYPLMVQNITASLILSGNHSFEPSGTPSLTVSLLLTDNSKISPTLTSSTIGPRISPILFLPMTLISNPTERTMKVLSAVPSVYPIYRLSGSSSPTMKPTLLFPRKMHSILPVPSIPGSNSPVQIISEKSSAAPTFLLSGISISSPTIDYSIVPTANPTVAISTTVQVIQFLPSVMIEEDSYPLFSAAVKNSISLLLSIPITAITGVTIKSIHRRKLLTGTTLSYTIHWISGVTTDILIAALKQSISNGRFSIILTADSGIQIGEITDFQLFNYSLTLEPTYSPSQASEQNTGDTTIYIIIISGTAAGCFVCIFFALIASFYYYKKERPRDRIPMGLFGNYVEVEVEVEVGIVIEAVDVTLISEIQQNGTFYSVEPVGNGDERIAKNDVPILNTSVVFVPSPTITNDISSSSSSSSSSS